MQDHTIAPADARRYVSPDTGAVLKAIGNPFPQFATQQEHCIDLPELCPASHNPGAGSYLRIRYDSKDRFLEVFSLRDYVQAFIAHPLVRDVEHLSQAIARDCQCLLGHAVEVEGYFVLAALGQTVRTCVRTGA